MKIFGYVTLLTAALGGLVQGAPAEKRQAAAPIQVVYPNYIIPIKQNAPDTAFGSQYRGEVYYHSFAGKNETHLLLGFDMPANAATKCQLAFNLPPASQGGFPWTQTGNPTLFVYGLSRIVELTDSWNKRPARLPEGRIASITLRSAQFPDASQSLIQGTIPCNKGQRLDLELAYNAKDGAGHVDWFEMSSPRTGITIEMLK